MTGAKSRACRSAEIVPTSDDRDAENYGEPNRLWIAWPDEEEVGTTEEPVV